jgi:hypothetical protein
MATIGLNRPSTRPWFRLKNLFKAMRARKRPEFAPPARALRSAPAPADLPKDQLGREIALLLWYHPNVAMQIGPVDLRAMSPDSKRALLKSARGMLGVKPLKREKLGYVGP